MTGEKYRYKIGISFGALVEPIAKQIVDQGKTASIKDMKMWQKHADAITRLRLHNLLTDSQVHAARKKLMKYISEGVK